MVSTKVRIPAALVVAGGVLLVGLFLLSNARVDGVQRREDAPSPKATAVLPRPALQSTPAFTTNLPFIVRGYPPPPPVFGVQMPAIDNSHGLTRAVEAGVHWVRFSAFHWDRIEPVRTNPPTYHWDQVDETSLSNAQASGFQTIAIIQFTPSWAQQYPGSYCGPIHPDRLDEFAQFLGALVNRYKNPPYNVKYWELGNEPDHPLLYDRHFFGCWGISGDPYYGGRYYGEMLKYAYPAIRAADPEAKVLIGGLLLDRPSGGSDTAPYFLEGVLRSGAGPYFDGVSYHVYAYYGGTTGSMGNSNWPGATTAIPEKTAFVRSVLNRFGYGDKLLFNTESALLCFTATSQCFDTQGMYVPKAFAEALALGLTGQTYYDLSGTWRNSGLLEPDLTPKPAYYTFQTAASFLSEVDYVGPVAAYPSTPHVTGYTFLKWDQSGYVDVIWTVDGLPEIVILSGGAVAYNRYGASIGGGGYIDLTYEPVYVVRP